MFGTWNKSTVLLNKYKCTKCKRNIEISEEYLFNNDKTDICCMNCAYELKILNKPNEFDDLDWGEIQ